MTGLSYGTLYYVYADDPEFAGGSLAYQVTTNKETAMEAAGRLFIGSITTPIAGAPDTIGNNDGGSGTVSSGKNNVLGFSLQFPSGSTSGNGNVANPGNAVDNNFNTFAALTATANGSGTQNNALIVLQQPPSINRGYSSATLNVKCGIPVNSVAGSGGGGGFIALISYTIAGNVFNHTIASVNVGSGTVPVQTFSFALPVGLNLSQVAIEATIGLTSGQTSGSVEIDFYGAEIVCVE